MNPVRIALANIRFPATPEESIALAEQAIDHAAIKGARIICFPECFIPGYRGIGKPVPPADPEFLERAWSVIAESAAKANMTVVLGTERFVDGALVATALVIDRDGSIAGFQDKVQIDPSEEAIYTPGSGRRVFQAGPVTFGIVICHEGWRIRRPSAGPHGAGHTLCFIRTSMKRSQVLTGQRSSPIPRIHFTRRRPCAAPPKHLLFRNRQLRESRLSDHVGSRPSGWDTTQLPALRRGRIADRRHRHHRGDWPICGTLQNGLEFRGRIPYPLAFRLARFRS